MSSIRQVLTLALGLAMPFSAAVLVGAMIADYQKSG